MRTSNERILMVDDEQPIIKVMARTMQSLGYLVETTTSSMRALELFQANPMGYDLVISDLTMPELSGEQLCQALLRIRPDIPIIICTGYNPGNKASWAGELGISRFLEKPVSRQDLAQAIRRSIDGTDISPLYFTP